MASPLRDTSGFDDAFMALDAKHRAPLKWQSRLHHRLARGDVPGVCRLPTGLGKTSVVAIWLAALAASAPNSIPRRLVYIVNRRTVVDQSTDDARRLLARVYRSAQVDGLPWATEEAVRELGLDDEPPIPREHVTAMKRLRVGLEALCGQGPEVRRRHAPLAVSTLRGELADNGEWKGDPARPAIIIGTVDMIGSKLLFSGYGDGRHGRAHHAGLIGQDALVVHDESHLSPAFDALLRSVAAEQARCGEPRPIRVMSLSATTRALRDPAAGDGSQFGIEDEDRNDPVVAERLSARKALVVMHAEKGEAIAAIVDQALELGASPSRVLVYVRAPDSAAEVAKAIGKALGDTDGLRVAVLTGTIRGKERDALAEGEVLRAFAAGSDRSRPLPHSLYLVSNAAGEVGADWDADHLVCDLTTLDSMAQRLGRVNRLGGDGRKAAIVVVIEKGKPPEGAQKERKASPFDAAVAKTGEILRRIANSGGDVSPAKIGEVITDLSDEDKLAAFSPVPKILRSTDTLFDHWSLTSIAGEIPGRPEVGPYLHGVADWEQPETHVAWRADIALLAAAGPRKDDRGAAPCSPADLEAVFEVFPLRSVERLRDRTDRVQDELRRMAARLTTMATRRTASPIDPALAGPGVESETAPEDPGDDGGVPRPQLPGDPWVVLIQGPTARCARLSELAPDDRQDREAARQVLAFATVVLPVEAGGLAHGALDGNEPAPEDARSLDVAESEGGGASDRRRVVVRGGGGGESPLVPGAAAADDARFLARHRVDLNDGDDDGATRAIEYRVAKGQDREPGERIGLDAHSAAAASAAERMARALGLREPTIAAIVGAARLHDAGKDRAIWQRYANNLPHPGGSAGPVAKSVCYGHGRQLGGYRHEFGSLHDALSDDGVRSLAPDLRDLALHLVAAHHGWGRPHFEPRHFDPGDPPPGRARPTAENERLAIEVMTRFARLQRRHGRWGLAWLESILRCADAEASQSPPRAVAASDAAPRSAASGGPA